MMSFYKFIELSKKIAFSFLKEKDAVDLRNSKLFDAEDKEYIYKRITKEEFISERNEMSELIDVDEDWKIVKNRINLPVEKKIFWKYAAAAVLVGFLMSIPFLLERKIEISPIVEGSTTIENKDFIVVGSDKATLTLEDGFNIELKKGEKINIDFASSNGQKLVYKKSNTTDIKYNYLTVPRGGQYFIELSDGTEVWLNSESQLKFPITFINGRTREVELVYGEAYFTVSPSVKHNGDTFKVINQGQEIDVLGTEFNVKAYKDEDKVYTTLVEGKVTVSVNKEGKEYLLPNQQSILNIENNNIQIAIVDVETVVSWKKGLFSFKGKSLKEIMKVISRWYDVDVVFEDKSLENINFKGVLGKDQNIEEILSSIKTLSVINNYEIKGKTIILN